MSRLQPSKLLLLILQRMEWKIELKMDAYYKLNPIRTITSHKSPVDPSTKMTEMLRQRFPQARNIDVTDISSGCGAMYEIFVESEEFKGLSVVKQHRLINEVLKDDIEKMHGVRIQTKIPNGN